MNRAHGTITLVQEERFQLDCDDGTKRLFVLSHKAPLEADELVALLGEHVAVDYVEASRLRAHTAHRIRKEAAHGEVRH